MKLIYRIYRWSTKNFIKAFQKHLHRNVYHPNACSCLSGEAGTPASSQFTIAVINFFYLFCHPTKIEVVRST